jgi:hypothetical protein
MTEFIATPIQYCAQAPVLNQKWGHTSRDGSARGKKAILRRIRDGPVF